MNHDDFRNLTRKAAEPQISYRSFPRGTSGTLLLGYTCDREEFHVYLKDGYIHRLIYREKAHTIETVEYEWFASWKADRLVPDKRVFPESTDPLMARLLRDAGVDVPYTLFDDSRYDRVCDEKYHALIKEELG